MDKQSYTKMIETYADEIVNSQLEKSASTENELDEEVMDLAVKTAALYEDAGERMDAALSIINEAKEVLAEITEEDVTKLAEEGDDESIEVIARLQERYNASMEVLAAAEEDAEACETVLSALGLLDESEDME